MDGWLIDETKSVDEKLLRTALSARSVTMRRRSPPLAVRINDMIIHDTRKWFGSADIRVDAMVVHGRANDEEQDYYVASTFRFGGIKDDDRLPIEEPGQRIFYGHPAHFLDVSVFVSRDSSDSDALASAIDAEMNTDAWKAASTAVLAATGATGAAAIVGAVSGAATISNATYKILKNLTGNTIGLYRTSWLQYADRFGLGRHPKTGVFRQQDFSFWYSIELDKKAGAVEQ